jgi:hypothetical protein
MLCVLYNVSLNFSDVMAAAAVIGIIKNCAITIKIKLNTKIKNVANSCLI